MGDGGRPNPHECHAVQSSPGGAFSTGKHIFDAYGDAALVSTIGTESRGDSRVVWQYSRLQSVPTRL